MKVKKVSKYAIGWSLDNELPILPLSPPQEKMYDKIVLYTSSLLMIAGAYMMK